MLCVRITSLGLALALFRPRSWVRHLLLANSLVGAVYMLVEWRALRDVGTCLPWGGRLPMGLLQNVVVNLLVHVWLPSLAKLPPSRGDDLAVLAGLAAVYLTVVDVSDAYPVRELPLAVYVVAHLTTVVLSCVMIF